MTTVKGLLIALGAALALTASSQADIVYGPSITTPYGPGKLGAKNFVRVTVPAGKSVTFSFDAGGFNENMIVLTAETGDGKPQMLFGKGNYHRDKRPHTIAPNTKAVTYVISGWCKDGPPNARIGWLFSTAKVLDARPGIMVVGFDDSVGDFNYTDARCWVVIK